MYVYKVQGFILEGLYARPIKGHMKARNIGHACRKAKAEIAEAMQISQNLVQITDVTLDPG